MALGVALALGEHCLVLRAWLWRWSSLSFDVLVQVGVDIKEGEHIVWQISYPLYIWCFLTVEEGNVRPLS